MRLREGFALRLTGGHRVRKVNRITHWTCKTEWRRTDSLQLGDKLLLHHHDHISWEGALDRDQGYLLGLLVGDGTLKQDAAVLSVWAEPVATNRAMGWANYPFRAVIQAAENAARSFPHRADFSGFHEVPGRAEFRMTLASVRDLAFKLGMKPGQKPITPAMESASSDFYSGFLRGLFDADGSVQGTQTKGVSVRLAQSDLTRLEAVQRMLLRLGIVSRIYKNRRKRGTSLLPDGKGGYREYATKSQHELVISGENICIFDERVGFYHSHKLSHLRALINQYKRKPNREHFVATVDDLSVEPPRDVFGTQILGIHTFDGNGLLLHDNSGLRAATPY